MRRSRISGIEVPEFPEPTQVAPGGARRIGRDAEGYTSSVTPSARDYSPPVIPSRPSPMYLGRLDGDDHGLGSGPISHSDLKIEAGFILRTNDNEHPTAIAAIASTTPAAVAPTNTALGFMS